MAILGEYKIPSRSFDESVDLACTIVQSFDGEVERKILAAHLGMAERGGAFAAHVGALRQWGMAKGRSTITLTQDALCLTGSCSDIEKRNATVRSAKIIPFFLELFRHMSKFQFDKAKIAILTREITGATRENIKPYESLIERTFIELKWRLDEYENEPAVQEILSSKETPINDFTETQNGGEGSFPVSGIAVPNTGRIRVYLSESSVIDLEETPENYDAAMIVLWVKRNQLTEREGNSRGSRSSSIFTLSNKLMSEDGE